MTSSAKQFYVHFSYTIAMARPDQRRVLSKNERHCPTQRSQHGFHEYKKI